MSGIQISNMEALAELFDNGWTTVQYKKNRKRSKACNALRHPSWHDIEKAKKECTPTGIHSDEMSVTISMQDAINHQIAKIMKDQQLVEWMERLAEQYPNISFEMDVKEGADGSSQYSPSKNSHFDDKSLFASNMVPLFISAIDNDTEESTIIWANKFANSALGVIPLRWAFEKETTGMFLTLCLYVCLSLSSTYFICSSLF